VNDDVQRFIELVPIDRRPLFDMLQATILRLYPDATVTLSYRVPTYRTKSGWVALGYWKGGVSLYTNGAHNIAGFKVEQPHIRTGTGSINFRLNEALPTEAVERVIRQAMEGPTQTKPPDQVQGYRAASTRHSGQVHDEGGHANVANVRAPWVA